jgi:Protein phosphatase 2C
MFKKHTQQKGHKGPDSQEPLPSGLLDEVLNATDGSEAPSRRSSSSQVMSADALAFAESISPRLYGEKTTFGSMPWWSDRDWWKLAHHGEGNDIRAHVGTVGDLAVAAASVRGHKHRLGGMENQDSYATKVTTLDDGRSFAIVAVCDGMGSSQYSSFGARLFAHHMVSILALTVDHCPNDFDQVLVEGQFETIEYVSKQVLAYRLGEFGAPNVSRDTVEVRDLQCTVTFAVIPAFSNDDSGRRTALFGFIGDSPAFRLAENEWLRIDQDKDGSGVWSSATEGAINSSGMDLRNVDLSPGSAVLLTSDGVGNFIRFNDQMTSLGLDLAQKWSQPVGLLDFVRDLSFETQSADDDRTAAVIWIDR